MPQRIVSLDPREERFDLGDKCGRHLVCSQKLVQYLAARIKRDLCHPPIKSIVNFGYRLVAGVHRSNEKDVRWNPGFLSGRQEKRLTPPRRLHICQRLTEDTPGVAAAEFVNYNHEPLILMLLC